MNLLAFFRPKASAPLAKERLQILLSHDRAVSGRTDLVSILREEILAVIGKHVEIDPDKVQIKMDRGDPLSVLEIDIEVPTPMKKVA